MTLKVKRMKVILRDVHFFLQNYVFQCISKTDFVYEIPFYHPKLLQLKIIITKQ